MNQPTVAPAATVPRDPRQTAALRQFAISITLLTIIGHAFLGFEQSIAQPIVAVLVGYTLQLLLERLVAGSQGRPPAYEGGWGRLLTFLLPTHIACLSIAMLTYYNERLWIVAFSVSVAVASKTVLRVPVGQGSRHFFNPSNFALTTTFILFPSVGLTMPWQWTTELSGAGDWLLPLLILAAGTTLHLRFASRIWVVVGFLLSFLVQAFLRSLVLSDLNLVAALAPATGVAALIFTFYMAPDPATSPANPRMQLIFGASISFVYMVLMLMNIVFALFYALTLVCLVRGVWMGLTSRFSTQAAPAYEPATT